MKTITHTQAQAIIDIACESWKNILFNEWGKAIVLKESITFPNGYYEEMRDACTSEQHKLFDKIFGSDNKKEFKPGDWVVRTKNEHVGMEVGDIDQIVKVDKVCSNIRSLYLKKYIGTQNACHDADYFRLATELEIHEAQFIPKGTPCLVRDDDDSMWKFTYSLGNGRFQSISGTELSWNQFQVLDIDNLPKY